MKMFVIVRRDLTPSQQAVQGGHALAEFLLNQGTWWKNGTLIYLGVKGVKQLNNLMMKFNRDGIKYSVFYEPDMEYEPTAIATDCENRFIEKLNLL